MTFHQYDNAPAAALALAQAVADNLHELLSQQDRATLAVSGGRSPISFFTALSHMPLAWDRVNITLVDERCVPADHADSNGRLVCTHLLHNHAAKARWIPFIDTSSPADDAQTYLKHALAHFVQPNIIVLGMGNDGHTASLFPQAPQLAAALDPNAPQPLVHISPITAPHERLSMTLATIERAQYVYLAIGGAEKHAIYAQAAQHAHSDYPIGHVLHSHKVSPHVYFHA